MFSNLKLYSTCKNSSLECIYGEEVDSEIGVILNFNNFEYLEKLLCKITIRTKGQKNLNAKVGLEIMDISYKIILSWFQVSLI